MLMIGLLYLYVLCKEVQLKLVGVNFSRSDMSRRWLSHFSKARAVVFYFSVLEVKITRKFETDWPTFTKVIKERGLTHDSKPRRVTFMNFFQHSNFIKASDNTNIWFSYFTRPYCDDTCLRELYGRNRYSAHALRYSRMSEPDSVQVNRELPEDSVSSRRNGFSRFYGVSRTTYQVDRGLPSDWEPTEFTVSIVTHASRKRSFLLKNLISSAHTFLLDLSS